MSIERTPHANRSRRNFLISTAVGAVTPMASGCASPMTLPAAGVAPAQPAPNGAGAAAARMSAVRTDTIAMRLYINGTEHPVNLDPRTTLLDALRDHIGLVGTKKGCDHGQCGACTVHADGERVLSCLTLAVQAQGHALITIEGLARGGALHPMQQAFIDNDAFQCGYCTPGQIMSAVALVAEGRASSASEIREYMSGNLCRCAAYPNIVAAVQQVTNHGGGRDANPARRSS